MPAKIWTKIRYVKSMLKVLLNRPGNTDSPVCSYYSIIYLILTVQAAPVAKAAFFSTRVKTPTQKGYSPWQMLPGNVVTPISQYDSEIHEVNFLNFFDSCHDSSNLLFAFQPSSNILTAFPMSNAFLMLLVFSYRSVTPVQEQQNHKTIYYENHDKIQTWPRQRFHLQTSHRNLDLAITTGKLFHIADTFAFCTSYLNSNSFL